MITRRTYVRHKITNAVLASLTIGTGLVWLALWSLGELP